MSDEFTIEKDVPIPAGRYSGGNDGNQAALRSVLLAMEIGDSVFVPLEKMMPSMRQQPSVFLGDILRSRELHGIRPEFKDRKFTSRTVWADGNGSGGPNGRVRLGLRIWRVASEGEGL